MVEVNLNVGPCTEERRSRLGYVILELRVVSGAVVLSIDLFTYLYI